MKKYLKIVVLTILMVAFSVVAMAEAIIVQNEVSQEKQLENSLTSNVTKENRLSSTRTKDKKDSNNSVFKGADNKQMIKYKQFNDGEGDLKTTK
jgi:hypothetical protein